jgi:adenylylsulfate kinase-like enzyme
MIFWFFGQPCSGKTTLINETIKLIDTKNTLKYSVLDNDAIRRTFKDTDYSRIGRERNVQRAMDIALYENSKYPFVFAGFVSPFNFQRLWLQEMAGVENVGFVYLHYNHKYDTRGRENYHVQDFEFPHGLINYIRLDTGLIPQHQCVKHILKFYVKMLNKGE